MRIYFIEFFSEETLSIRGESCPIPQKDDEVFLKGNRYHVMSILYDLDSNRVQIYLEKR